MGASGWRHEFHMIVEQVAAIWQEVFALLKEHTDSLKDCKIHYLEQLCYKIFGWQIVVDSRRICLFVKCGKKNNSFTEHSV